MSTPRNQTAAAHGANNLQRTLTGFKNVIKMIWQLNSLLRKNHWQLIKST